MSADRQAMWTVYDRPSDYPANVVARLWEILPDGTMRSVAELVGPTLEWVRAMLPLDGLVRIPRDVSDDPVIVETWL